MSGLHYRAALGFITAPGSLFTRLLSSCTVTAQQHHKVLKSRQWFPERVFPEHQLGQASVRWLIPRVGSRGSAGQGAGSCGFSRTRAAQLPGQDAAPNLQPARSHSSPSPGNRTRHRASEAARETTNERGKTRSEGRASQRCSVGGGAGRSSPGLPGKRRFVGCRHRWGERGRGSAGPQPQ